MQSVCLCRKPDCTLYLRKKEKKNEQEEKKKELVILLAHFGFGAVSRLLFTSESTPEHLSTLRQVRTL